MNQYVDNILHAFAQLDDDNDQLQRIQTLAPELNWVEPADIDALLINLAELSGGISPNILDRGLEIVVGRLSRQSATAQPDDQPLDVSSLVQAISQLYLAILPESRGRNYLLGWLANMNRAKSLDRFVDLILESPPTCPNSIVMAFAPLLKVNNDVPIDHLFPKLLGGLQHRSVAAAILDLANFLTREKRVAQHPASGHSESLIKLLGMLTEQLTMLEEGKIPEGKQPNEISAIVNDTVSLIASLCDSLALVGDENAIGKLNRASELKHRRIRTEALWALASLGQESSGQQLIELAAEPISRLRVIQYARELDLIDEVDEQYTSDESIAESQLAMWLAHPSNMGLAPKELQLMDQRFLAWPGFDDPQSCFLFRYSYELSQSRIDNIGISGPLCHAFSMNLQHLANSDIYACFAGWHCTHEEIMEMGIPQARLQRPGLVERLTARLSSEQIDELDFENMEPQFLGLFMGAEALILNAKVNGQWGTLIVTRDTVDWFPADPENSPAKTELAYSIYKGRKLLGAFNQPEFWPGLEETTHD